MFFRLYKLSFVYLKGGIPRWDFDKIGQGPVSDPDLCNYGWHCQIINTIHDILIIFDVAIF